MVQQTCNHPTSLTTCGCAYFSWRDRSYRRFFDIEYSIGSINFIKLSKTGFFFIENLNSIDQFWISNTYVVQEAFACLLCFSIELMTLAQRFSLQKHSVL